MPKLSEWATERYRNLPSSTVTAFQPYRPIPMISCRKCPVKCPVNLDTTKQPILRR